MGPSGRPQAADVEVLARAQQLVMAIGRCGWMGRLLQEEHTRQKCRLLCRALNTWRMVRSPACMLSAAPPIAKLGPIHHAVSHASV